MKSDTAAAWSLLGAPAVRERASRMLALGLSDRLPHFRVDLRSLDKAIDVVVETTRQRYPALDVPFHARWRHFVFNGEDRWAALNKTMTWRDRAARARTAFDLAIISVLLDAGAGSHWHFHDSVTGQTIGRSEGLALASLDMFRQGIFSSNPHNPLQADAEGLMSLTDEALANGLQVSSSNSLIGVGSRAELLRKLGALVVKKADIFGGKDTPRPGGLFDHLATSTDNREISAATILAEVLRHFGSIWPSRLALGGISLGDCWYHPALASDDATSGLVPLHKLSQWLAYSLIEPLQWSGFLVVDVDDLTGLAEYRNGGLFIDTGVLKFRNFADATCTHDVGAPLVVEWRALTVALLDELAEGMRRRLTVDKRSFPLAKVLQGGTWAAGRIIAHKLRHDGSPPIKVHSDGTVF